MVSIGGKGATTARFGFPFHTVIHYSLLIRHLQTRGGFDRHSAVKWVADFSHCFCSDSCDSSQEVAKRMESLECVGWLLTIPLSVSVLGLLSNSKQLNF